MLTYVSLAMQILASSFQVNQSMVNNIWSETQALVLTHLFQYELHLFNDVRRLSFPLTTASDCVGNHNLLASSVELMWISLQNFFFFCFTF